MKKLLIILFATSFLFRLCGEVSAQTKKKSNGKKTTRKKTAKLSNPTLPLVAAKPCEEEEINYPYGTFAGSNQKPPKVVVNPCLTTGGITTPLRILSKPSPDYTEAARNNKVNGTVRLRVTFLANGTIGQVTPISGLSHGLTEKARAAAYSILFEPAKKDSNPITITKQIEYNFNLF